MVAAKALFREMTETIGDRVAQQISGLDMVRVEDLGAILSASHEFSSELNLEQLVKKVTEVGVSLTNAEIGAFFYTSEDDEGYALTLHSIVGAKQEDFSHFAKPRLTSLLSPDMVIRVGDVSTDPRFQGMPPGHLPVVSYLAVPVITLSKRRVGVLLFGHSQPDIFDERTEALASAIAAQASVSVDNALLFREARSEITKRERMEAGIRMMTELAPSVIFSREPNGELLYVSQFFYDYTGLDHAMSPTEAWALSIHPDDRLNLCKAWDHAVENSTTYHAEGRVLRHDGEYRWFQSHAVPTFEDGKVVRWMGNAIDIHDLKMVEADLAEINATLEAKVAERTIELEESQRQVLEEIASRQSTEEALRQAQKMESVGQLTGGIAHDFNNMLTVIIGNLELTKMTLAGCGEMPASKRMERQVSIAIEAAIKAEKLTAQLLAFSRKSRLHPERLDVNDVVRGVHDMVQRAVGVNVSCNLDLEDNPWLCLSDKNQLESAILNLAINGRDAMPEGGCLLIKTRNRQVEDTRYVSVSVSDTGTGMTQETISKAFEPFFTTKDVGKGSGLGLSMVYGFCQQSNGKVFIDSVLGRGTTIEMLFPYTAGDTTRQTNKEEDFHYDANKASILIVDDEPGVRELAAAALSDMGYNVMSAEDGERALEVISNSEITIDLLFTDVVMPNGIDGFQLAKAAHEIRPNMPILFTTGHAEVALKELKKDQHQKIKVLGKPYRLNDLSTMIASELRSKQI